MSQCLVNDTGLHLFARVGGGDEEPIIKLYLTCLACGERRAIGVLGDLLVRKNKQWVKLEPGDQDADSN